MDVTGILPTAAENIVLLNGLVHKILEFQGV